MIRNHNISRQSFALFILLVLIFGQESYAQKGKIKIPEEFAYELKPLQETGLMLTGTGLLYASVIGHMNKQAWGEIPVSRLNPQNINFIDRPAINNWKPKLNNLREFFEPALSIGIIGGIGTYGILAHQQNKNWSGMLNLTLMYFEGLYISTGTELFIKSLVNRPRPYTYNNDLPMEQRTRPGNNESFFSGNATIMFYNATFLSMTTMDLFPDASWTPYVVGGSFALSTLSGIWSVKSGMHFTTDVFTGALWGSATALFITGIHKKGAKGLNIMPWAIEKGRGLAIRYLF